MRFIYPVRFQPDSTGEIIVSFRDLQECIISGSNRTEAQAAAADALEEAIAGRIDDGEEIPMPSPRRAGEHFIAAPADMAAKAALVLAFRESGLSHVAMARHFGVDDKVIRRMLDPRHGTASTRIHKALRVLGREPIVESRAT